MQDKRIAIWLDCDPGLDDTFAIIYAAHNPQLHLLGVSTSPGNTSLKNTTRNALDVLYNIGRSDIPVFAGSNQILKGEMVLAEHMHGGNGLGGVNLPQSPKTATTEHSFEHIYRKIKEHQGKVIWANTGSLTNFTIMLLAYPDILDRIEKVVIMGGAVGKGNITPAAEFNIFFDAHACAQTLRLLNKAKVPFVMFPLEVTHQNVATQSIFDHLHSKLSIPFAQACYTMLQQYQKMYKVAYNIPYPPIHDPCPIFYLLHPQEFEVHKCWIVVDTCEASYGRTNVFFESPMHPGVTEGKEQYVAMNLRNEKVKFWEEMLAILDEIFSEKIQEMIKIE